MSGAGFRSRTHCHRGHDLAVPDAIGFDSNSGKRFCRLCRNLRKRQSLERQRVREKACGHCGARIPIERKWRFCSSSCEEQHRQRNDLTMRQEDATYTLELLALYDRLDRAATSWERADIKALIEQRKKSP